MSNQDNEQVMSQPRGSTSKFFKRPAVWIVSAALLLVIAASVIGYYIWNVRNQAEQARLWQIQQEQEALAKEQAEYEAARNAVLIDTFYEGIFVGGVDLAGLTKKEAESVLLNELTARIGSLEYSVEFADQQWNLTLADLEITTDLDTVIVEAWKLGRISGEQTEKAQIFDRLETIEALRSQPVNLEIKSSINSKRLEERLKAITSDLAVEPISPEVTGFNTSTRKFEVSAGQDGLSVSYDSVLSKLLSDFEQGIYQSGYQLEGKTIIAPDSDLAARVAGLGRVSSATTYAAAVDAARDNNISLITRALNGHVILPGETFSFNGVIGRRTPEKGYQAAGAIFDGALIKTVGGGICQPNTTLYQAALKADLRIVERYPHQFPSSYTTVGLDAAIDWGSADMKFENNTDYPIAIVCWYKKPELTFQIYGRGLPDGMTISLSAETTANQPPEAPIEELDPELEPGARVLERTPHNMMRATSYKIYSRNGEHVRTEKITNTYYPPIRAIYKVGPPLPEPEENPEQPQDPASEPTVEVPASENESGQSPEPTTADAAETTVPAA